MCSLVQSCKSRRTHHSQSDSDSNSKQTKSTLTRLVVVENNQNKQRLKWNWNIWNQSKHPFPEGIALQHSYPLCSSRHCRHSAFFDQQPTTRTRNCYPHFWFWCSTAAESTCIHCGEEMEATCSLLAVSLGSVVDCKSGSLFLCLMQSDWLWKVTRFFQLLESGIRKCKKTVAS